MKAFIQLLVLCAVMCSCFGMRLTTWPENFDDTAQFRTESPIMSPVSTPRTTPRLDLKTLQETPRSVSSFLYALMNTYQVDVVQSTVQFPDYLAPDRNHSLPVGLLSDWLVVLQEEVRKYRESKQIGIDATQMNADQRDLQFAQKKLWEFINCADLLPSEIVAQKYSTLLSTARAIRLNAFVEKNIHVIVAAKYLSVHYHHLVGHEVELDPQKAHRSCWRLLF